MENYNLNITKQDVDKAIADARIQLEKTYGAANTEVLNESWFACNACKIGLTATISGAITIILSGAPVIGSLLALIASVTGIPLVLITSIINEFIKIGASVDRSSFFFLMQISDCYI